MKGKRLASSGSHVGKEGGEEGVGNQVRGEIMLGDLLWVRLHGSSWWPAQVVDANAVSERVKPSNRSVGEVLVRLYGSYNYLYVDPMKCRCEFENLCKQYNGNYTEIFRKALEQDLPGSKCRTSKGQGSNSKVRVEVSNDETLKQNQIEENQETEASKSRSGVLGKHFAASVQGTRAQKTNLVAKSFKDNVSENERMEHHDVKKNNLMSNGTFYQARVSPRRQSAAITQQTTVRNGDILSEIIEEAKRKTSEQNESLKKKQNNPSVEREAKCRRKKPKPNGTCNEEEAIDNISGQDGVQKKLKPNSPSIEDKARGKTSKQDVVPKKLRLNSPSVKGEGKGKNSKQEGVLKKHKPSSAGAEEAKSKTSKQDGVQKKFKLNSPKTGEEAKRKTSRQDGVQKKHKPNSPSVAKEAKSKTSDQDGLQKKLKPNGVQNKLKRNSLGVEEEAKCKTPKQDRVRKKLKPNSPGAEEAKSSETPEENRMQKKLKPNSPNSETTSLGKSQLSARRMKVMQSLGLIAPSGSPFNRDSHI